MAALSRGAAFGLAVLAAGWRVEAQPLLCVEGPTVSGGSYDRDAVMEMATYRVPCARVRLRRDLWRSIGDPARLGALGRTLRESYDALFDDYRSVGITVHLVVGADAAGADNAAFGRDAEVRARWLDAWTEALGYWGARVPLFEMLDAPNLRLPGGAPGSDVVAPEVYAAAVLDAWRAVPGGGRPGCGRPEVVLGGLRHGPAATVGDAPSAYLDALYAAGTRVGWTAIRASQGTAPFEAIALQWDPGPIAPVGETSGIGGDPTADVEGDLVPMYRWREGDAHPLRVHITEMRVPFSDLPERGLEEGNIVDEFFRQAAADVDGHLASASWYAFLDPPWDPGGFGFYRDNVLNATHRRPWPATSLGSALNRYRPRWGARLVFAEPLVRVRPGEHRRVTLWVTHDGPSGEFPWPSDGSVRVGASPGCPLAEGFNNVEWSAFPDNGGVPGRFDGRVNLPRPVFFGGVTRALEWEITAPPEPSRYDLSARMVRTRDLPGDAGEAWFGETATAVVEVVPADADLGDDIDAALVDAGDVVDVASTVDAGSAQDATVSRDLPGDVPGRDQGTFDAATVADLSAPDVGTRAASTPAGGCACAIERRPRGATPGLALACLALAATRRRRRQKASRR